MKRILVLFTLAALACATVQAQQSVQVISFTGTTWRYHTNNADQGTAWRAVTFNDSAAPWFPGQGVLGFEPGNPQSYLPGFNTTFTAYTPAIITYYFRARFTNNLGPPLSLLATNLVDDGLVMYINGVEAARIRVPAGQTWQTQANAQPTTEGQEDVVSIDPSLLRLGTNVIAVEVHQNGTGSSDVAFGMSMMASFPAFTPMTIIAQPQNVMVPVGDDYTLNVGVSGGPGYFQWQANNGAGQFTNIPGAISATLTNRAALLGTNAYRVQIFNGTQTLTSTSAVVTVTLDTFGPRMLSAVVREETTRTNRIIVTWDEALTNSTACVACFTNFRVIMAASNIPVTISNMQYNPTGGAEFKPATILTMSTTNWFVGSNYWVIANNFRDFYTNVVAPNTIIGVSWPITTNVFTLNNQAWNYHCNYFIDTLGGIDIYTQNWTATNYDVATSGASWGGPALGLHQFDILLTNASCFVNPAINDISYQEQPTLFRSTFMWPVSQATNVDLRFTYGADDGAAVFLNGSFLFKDNNFPTGPITAATRTGAESEGNCRTLVVPSIALRRGTNFLAVAVAQTDSDPADTVFGMNLDVIGLRTAPLPPNPTPSLSFARVGTNGFRLSWSTNSFGWALEYTTTTNMGLKPVGTSRTNFLSGPWLEVQPRMANPYVTNPVAGSHRIYRLRLKN